jgi:hypothetical protein
VSSTTTIASSVISPVEYAPSLRGAGFKGYVP